MATSDLLPLVQPPLWRVAASRASAILALLIFFAYMERRLQPLRTARSSLSLAVPVATMSLPVLQTAEQHRAEEELLSYVAAKQSAYPADLLVGSSDNYEPVSAILLHDGPRSTALVLRSLVLLPFVTEVILWNESGETLDRPTLSTIVADSQVDLRIVNSPGMLRSMSRYTACSVATHKTCYFASARYINPVADSLYALYTYVGGSRSPRLVQAVSSPSAWVAERLRFHMPGLDTIAAPDLMAAFLPRSMAVGFLAQWSARAMPAASGLFADQYFAMWANARHIQVATDLLEVPLEQNALSLRPISEDAVLDALRHLQAELSRPHERSDSPFRKSTSAATPTDTLAYAICANDQCSMSTTLLPFEQAAWVATGAKASVTSNEPHKLRSLERYEPFEGFPSYEWWMQSGSPHLAVDGSSTSSLASGRSDRNVTCWQTARAPSPTDKITLRLLPARPALGRLEMVGTPDLANVVGSRPEASSSQIWQIWTMAEDTDSWELRIPVGPPTLSPLGDPSLSDLVKVSIELRPAKLDGPISQLELRSLDTKSTPLLLCGWSLNGWSI